jgi:hypothetical protein
VQSIDQQIQQQFYRTIPYPFPIREYQTNFQISSLLNPVEEVQVHIINDICEQILETYTMTNQFKQITKDKGEFNINPLKVNKSKVRTLFLSLMSSKFIHLSSIQYSFDNVIYIDIIFICSTQQTNGYTNLFLSLNYPQIHSIIHFFFFSTP